MNLLASVLDFEKGLKEASLLGQQALSPTVSLGELKDIIAQLESLATSPIASSPLGSAILSALRAARNRLPELGIQEAAEAKLRMAGGQNLDGLSDILWTPAERARLDAIEPDKEYGKVTFDDNGNPIGTATVTGQEIKDSASLLRGLSMLEDKNLPAAERTRIEEQIHMFVLGHKDGSRDDRERDMMAAAAKKALADVKGNAAYRDPENQERYGREYAEGRQAIDRLNALEKQQDASKAHPGQPAPDPDALKEAQRLANETKRNALSDLLEGDGPTPIKAQEKEVPVANEIADKPKNVPKTQAYKAEPGLDASILGELSSAAALPAFSARQPTVRQPGIGF